LLNIALEWVFVMVMVLWGEFYLGLPSPAPLISPSVLSFTFFLFSYRHLATLPAPATEVVK
jgi:hypothetical protein